MFANKVFVVLSILSATLGYPTGGLSVKGGGPFRNTTVPSELQILAEGNKVFRENITSHSPGFLQTLVDEGQSPPFMFIGCSDSRVGEGTIFNARPGTIFTERNIANQFQSKDPNIHATLSYSVAHLGVKHVIVMGHYGCGGVAAAISDLSETHIDVANSAITDWVQPIHDIYLSSDRREIVQLRERNKGAENLKEPNIRDPGFRALVEENIKVAVHNIAADSVIVDHYSHLVDGFGDDMHTEGSHLTILNDVFIHGWVYDVENGEIRDLGISVGPPGREIPAIPFQLVSNRKIESEDNSS